jgi:hypothetical protein
MMHAANNRDRPIHNDSTTVNISPSETGKTNRRKFKKYMNKI